MKYSLLLFLALFYGGMAIAQDAKVTAGMNAFRNSNFEKALDHFNEAIKNIDKVKDKNLPKVYYFRGKSLLELMSLAEKDETYQKYSEVALPAYKDFKKAEQFDKGKKYVKAIDIQMHFLQGHFFRNATQKVLALNNSDLEKSELSEIQAAAEQHLSAIEEIQVGHYLTLDLSAQLKLYQRDSTTAHTFFYAAIDQYKDNPPAEPDFYIGYTCYRAALLDATLKQSPATALKTIQFGRQLLAIETQRLEMTKGDYPQYYEQKKNGFAKADEDLEKMELIYYTQVPDRYNEALNRFKSTINNRPEDYDLHIAYAGLLEERDSKGAISVYKKAIRIDESKELGHYRLGALYNRLANEQFEQAEENKNLSQAKSLNKEGFEQLEKALDSFEKAHRANPKSKICIRAIMQTAQTLNRNDIYQHFEKIERNMEGKQLQPR